MPTLEKLEQTAPKDVLLLTPRRLAWNAPFDWFKQAWRLYRQDWLAWSLFGWLFILLALRQSLGNFYLFLEPFTLYGEAQRLVFVYTTILIIGVIYRGLDTAWHDFKFRLHFRAIPDSRLNQLLWLMLAWTLVTFGLNFLLQSTSGQTFIAATTIPFSMEHLPAVFSWVRGEQNQATFQWHYLLLLLLALFFWFTVILISLHNCSCLVACQLSLKGVGKNMMALLIFIVLGYAMLLLTLIAYLLPSIVILPWLVCSLYSAYRQIFLEAFKPPQLTP